MFNARIYSMEVVHKKQQFFLSYSEECKEILVMCDSALNTNANVPAM